MANYYDLLPTQDAKDTYETLLGDMGRKIANQYARAVLAQQRNRRKEHHLAFGRAWSVHRYLPARQRYTYAAKWIGGTLYEYGELPPRYALPAIVPIRDNATYAGTWDCVAPALRFFNSVGGSGGINWTWAYFAFEHDAIGFDQWCDRNRFETRGVYPPFHENGWGVRYR